MSKARCVNNENIDDMGFDVGKSYGCVLEGYLRGERYFRVFSDKVGISINDPIDGSRFQLLPDEPKAEWMRLEYGVYLNMVTGIGMAFVSHDRHTNPYVWSIHDRESYQPMDRDMRDAFAALVGYTWKEG